MTITWDQAVTIVENRRAQQSGLLRLMQAVRMRYNGDYVLPIPDDSDDEYRPLVIAQLVDEAIDSPAQSAASTWPSIFCPAVDADKLEGKRSLAFADVRRRALAATFFGSKWSLLSRKMFRHIGGYGMASLVVIADERAQRPKLVLRDPLCTYPEPKAAEDLSVPANVGFVYAKSAGWLVSTFGAEVVGAPNGPVDISTSQWQAELYDVLEWMDADQTMIGIVGPTAQSWLDGRGQVVRGVHLRTFANRIGMVPAVVPQTITLDKVISRAAHMVGKMDALAYLWDLDLEHTINAISPDRFALSRPNERAKIISNGGKWQRGRSGKMNLVEGAAAVGELRTSPDPGVFQRIQAIESHAMVDAGVIGPQVGNVAGMAGSLRTGRGISTLAGVSIDPRVQELQEVACEALREITPAIFRTYRQSWPTKKYALFTGWNGDTSTVQFTPDTHMAPDENEEAAYTYAIPGADASAITVEVAQMSGADLASKSTLRRLHPHIADADAEERRLLVEHVEELTFQMLAQRAGGGGFTPLDMAALLRGLRQGQPLEDVMEAVDQAARQRQAAQVPPDSPAAQPGVAQPGEGAEGDTSGMPGGAPTLMDLTQAMRQPPPQMQFSAGTRAARLSGTVPQ